MTAESSFKQKLHQTEMIILEDSIVTLKVENVQISIISIDLFQKAMTATNNEHCFKSKLALSANSRLSFFTASGQFTLQRPEVTLIGSFFQSNAVNSA